MRPTTRLRHRSAAALMAVGLQLGVVASPAAAYPPQDAAYLDYAEMVAEITAITDRNPGIARAFSIGQSFEGRELWAATVSDNVATDEGEPEVLFDGGIHGREHMSTEMAVFLFRSLVDGYGSDPRVTRIVDSREVTILFNLNPDGSEHDHTASGYLSWRKNRQPTPGSSDIGTDINRNFAYHWGENTLNASAAANTYRGPAPWSTPEATAIRDYVESRVVGGTQQIRVHMTFHQFGRIVLYPFGWTTDPIPADMDAGDHAQLVAMATEMARRSGYAAAQSSSGEIHVGNEVDWMYATHRILSFTLEMGDSFTMPDEAIATETARNLDTALYAMEQAGGSALLPNTAMVRLPSPSP